MIDIGRILKRSWQILWDYKVLWIFGFLLAITAGRGGGGGGNNPSQYRFEQPNGRSNFDFSRGGPVMEGLGRWFEQNVLPILIHPEQHISTFIWLGIVLFLLILVVSVIAALIRYPSEVSVIRMVDEYEQTGTKVNFRAGWRLGWSRRAFRLWLTDLILSLPVILFVFIMFGAGLFIFAFTGRDLNSSLVGFVTSLICAIPFILILIGVVIFLGLLRNLFARIIALDDLGVGDTFRHGWVLFKQNWKSVGLIWLIMLGIGILYGLVSIIAFFILIPAYIVLAIPAALVAAIPGLLVFAIASLFTTPPLTWIIAVLLALPFFFVVAFAPLTFLQGWYLLYESNVWTLTYRELISDKTTQNLLDRADAPPVSK
jgi:hypothetical protein